MDRRKSPNLDPNWQRWRRIRDKTKAAGSWVFLLVSLLGYTDAALGQNNQKSIVVLYPAQSEGGVYDAVNTGIARAADRASAQVRYVPIRRGTSARTEAERHLSADVIVSLGRSIYDDLQQDESLQGRLLVGGVDLAADPDSGISGLTLLTDPAESLRKLKRISPETERVFVVYQPGIHDWLIQRAREVAADHDLEVVALDAQTLSEATTHYWNVLRYANPNYDSLWLLQSGTLISERDTLPRIIEQSWTKNFLVFSNSLAHVDRGIVFAVYVDPTELGEALMDRALEKASGSQFGIVVSEAHQTALNVRVARHHGFRISPAMRDAFDIVLAGQ